MRDTVVVVHGLGRTRASMSLLSKRLEKQGYHVINVAYPSTRLKVADSAEYLHRELEERLPTGTGKIHFVTHSLGGIVVRAYLQCHRPANLGSVVMLSPPNQDSEIADRLRHNWIYKQFTGPAGQELGTEASSTPNALGAVDYPLGVIAGDKSMNPLFSCWIAGRDDGKVSVRRAGVKGMTDLLVVPYSHTFIMRSSRVASQVTHFLAKGQFEGHGT